MNDKLKNTLIVLLAAILLYSFSYIFIDNIKNVNGTQTRTFFETWPYIITMVGSLIGLGYLMTEESDK